MPRMIIVFAFICSWLIWLEYAESRGSGTAGLWAFSMWA